MRKKVQWAARSEQRTGCEHANVRERMWRDSVRGGVCHHRATNLVYLSASSIDPGQLPYSI